MTDQDEQREYPLAPVEWGQGIGVEATIINCKYQDTPWGESLRMLIEVDTREGTYRLYGPVPKSLVDPEPGMRISMIANVKEPHDPEDLSFAYFARPRSAVFI